MTLSNLTLVLKLNNSNWIFFWLGCTSTWSCQSIDQMHTTKFTAGNKRIKVLHLFHFLSFGKWSNLYIYSLFMLKNESWAKMKITEKGSFYWLLYWVFQELLNIYSILFFRLTIKIYFISIWIKIFSEVKWLNAVKV